jgi:hypothetical protein
MKDLTVLPPTGKELVPVSSPITTIPKAPSHLHRGIKGLVCDSKVVATVGENASQSWVELLAWQTMDGYKALGRRKVYHSNERSVGKTY